MPDDPAPDDPMAQEFDLVVLGGGPGGYAAALYGASAGLNIAMVEEQRVGGTCLQRGCIPAKELLQTAEVLRTVKHAGDFGVGADHTGLDLSVSQTRKQGVVDRLTKGLEGLLKRRNSDAGIVNNLFGVTLDQSTDSDATRFVDLTWVVDETDHRSVVARLDRFAMEYRGASWGVTVGRQAVSWGNGMVFQPLDLFSPFAPTTVDQDYKAGDDLLLAERLLNGGGDLQLLAVGRRDLQGDRTLDVASIAGKWHGFVGTGELELVAGHHYRDQVYAMAVRIPLGGALVRSDLVATRLESGTWKLSGILNADYSLLLTGRNVYLFAE
jgi:hypothetical protein